MTQRKSPCYGRRATYNVPHSSRWRPNGHNGVSNHQPHDCLLNRLFRCRSKKTSKLRVTGLCVGNSPVTGEFPAQMARNAEMSPFDDVIMLYDLTFCIATMVYLFGDMSSPSSSGKGIVCWSCTDKRMPGTSVSSVIISASSVNISKVNPKTKQTL